jgi:hypothetical protein
MGLSAQQILGNDPEYLQRQLAQQEIQRYQNFQNPQLGAAATSGATIGRGIANLFSGRGFFDVSDPALRRVSEVNSIISQGLQGIDPNDPKSQAEAYANIARQLGAAGYAQPAALAAAEANKLGIQVRELGMKEETLAETKKRTAFEERRLLLEEVTKDPYGSIERAMLLPEDSPQRQAILASASDAIGKRNADQYQKQIEGERTIAQTQAARAQAAAYGEGKFSGYVTEDGKQLTDKGGRLYTADGKLYEGTVKKLGGGGGLELPPLAKDGKATDKPKGERKPLGSFDTAAQQSTETEPVSLGAEPPKMINEGTRAARSNPEWEKWKEAKLRAARNIPGGPSEFLDVGTRKERRNPAWEQWALSQNL